MRIYLAAPLFSQMQRTWNRQLAARIAAENPNWKILMAQDFRENGRFNEARSYPAVFRRCLATIRAADVLVAVLDGPDVDSGTAFEMGVAHALGKTVVGLRTDYRPGADHGVNLMCARACTYVVREFSFQENPQCAADALIRRLRRIARQHPPEE